MASLRTEITELATGLGMLGYDNPAEAVSNLPPQFIDVTDRVWEQFAQVVDESSHRVDFAGAYRNGQVFLEADHGLRGRPPRLIEWKGSHRSPGHDQLPIDLRVDHVYLISCKYSSKILLNAAPSNLFAANQDVGDWYDHAAPQEHQALYAAVREEVGSNIDLPPFVGDLAKHHRTELKLALADRQWSPTCAAAYRELAAEVGRVTASQWRKSVATKRQREALLWRLLRIGPAPYYVLGSARDRSLRLLVTTPWDWRRRFEFRDLEMWGEAAGQPIVGWKATVRDHEAAEETCVDGHVEVRWSHGRFAQAPEAKVYLDTPHTQVPGYLHIDDAERWTGRISGTEIQLPLS